MRDSFEKERAILARLGDQETSGQYEARLEVFSVRRQQNEWTTRWNSLSKGIWINLAGQKIEIPKWNPGKKKHGPKSAVCPSCLILSHSHLSSVHFVQGC